MIFKEGVLKGAEDNLAADGDKNGRGSQHSQQFDAHTRTLVHKHKLSTKRPRNQSIAAVFNCQQRGSSSARSAIFQVTQTAQTVAGVGLL